jgi:outer membrane protein assembly factor BamB
VPAGLVLAAALLAACGSDRPATPVAAAATPVPTCAPRAADRSTLPDEPRIDSPPGGTSDGTLLALDAATGAERWHRALPMATADLVVDGDRLVIKGSFGARQGGIYVSVDAATGKVDWRWPQSGWLQFSSYEPVSAGDGVVVAAGAGLTVLDAHSGTPLWGQRMARFGEGTVAAGNVVLPAVKDGATAHESHTERLVGYAACTGVQRWSTGEPLLTNVFGPVAAGKAVTAYTGETGPGTGASVVRVDAATGKQVWRVDLNGQPDNFMMPVLGRVTALEFTDSTASKTTRLALDPATGRELWRLDDKAFWARAAQGDGHVYFVADDGHVEAIAAGTGHVDWRTPVGLAAYTVAAGGGRVLSSTKSGVVALDGATGHEQWRLADPGKSPGLSSVEVAGDTVYVWAAGKAAYDDE